MTQTLRKTLKISGLVLGILLLLLIAAPFLFKDKIRAYVQEEINASLNAEVYFGDVGLSFIRNFPNARISIEDFGVVGKGRFAEDTLAQGKSFNLVVDLWSVIFGDEFKLKRVLLEEPRIRLLVTADGQANYDILISDSLELDTDTTESHFNLNLASYEIRDGYLFYDDATLPMRLGLRGLNHSGRGDFTEVNYELDTETQADEATFVYDGIAYLNRAKIDADAQFAINTAEDLRIQLLENLFNINDLGLQVNGSIAMPGEDIELDLSLKAPEANFRSLYSLIPGVFTAGYENIKIDGKLALDAFVKGTYNAERIPGFGMDLQVAEGQVQYPDLPESIRNIALDLKIENPDGDLEKTHIKLRQLNALIGQNPLEAQADIQGLSEPRIDGWLKGNLDLAQLSRAFPIEGTTLKGKFDVDATAKGTYSESRGTFPVVDARMKLADGYVKSEEYQTELTEFRFDASLEEAQGDLSKVVLNIPDFHFLLDGEPLDGSLRVADFNDPQYQLRANGRLNLAKVMQLYPIDSMTLSGLVIIEDFSTEGRYSDIEAERYTSLPTRGKAEVRNLKYADLWYVQPGFTVEQGTATFTAERMDISNARGTLGKSDYEGSGYFTNYLAYGLFDNEVLGGNLSVRSRQFIVDEWMVEEEASAGSTGEGGESAPYEVVPIPATFNLGINATVDQVVYDGMSLNNFQGKMTLAQEEIQLEDVNCELLGGKLALNGLYNTADIRQPKYNFYLNLEDFGIQEAFKNFTLVQAYAPIARLIEGEGDLELGISGFLDEKMMPVLDNVNGLGMVQVLTGAITQSNLFGKLAEKTQLTALKSSRINLEKILAEFEIKDGFVELSPIDFRFKDIVLTLSGRQNIAGKLDYSINIDAPPGAIGNAAFAALSRLSGGGLKASDRVQLNLKVGGTLKDPVISGGEGGTTDQLKEQAAELAEQKLKEKLGADVSLEQLKKDSLKAQAEEAKQQALDSLRRATELAKQRARDSINRAVEAARKEAEEKLKEEAKKKLGDEAADKLKDLKDRFGFPKKKKKEGGGG